MAKETSPDAKLPENPLWARVSVAVTKRRPGWATPRTRSKRKRTSSNPSRRRRTRLIEERVAASKKMEGSNATTGTGKEKATRRTAITPKYRSRTRTAHTSLKTVRQLLPASRPGLGFIVPVSREGSYLIRKGLGCAPKKGFNSSRLEDLA